MTHFDDFEIRRADKTDIPTLVDFIIQEAAEAEGISSDRDIIARGISAPFDDPRLAQYWKLTHTPTAKIVGSISTLAEWSDWNAAPYWWIQSMFIVKEFRGKGLMSLLVNRIEEEARKHGAVELRLYVHARNKTAIRAYEKTAFANTPYKIMVLC
jgi:GNAT superfamily N-acetyltransferase